MALVRDSSKRGDRAGRRGMRGELWDASFGSVVVGGFVWAATGVESGLSRGGKTEKDQLGSMGLLGG